MAPDERLFQRLLPLLSDAEVIHWLPPQLGESLPLYAERLAKTVAIDGPFIVCGVSFGGLVARELAYILKAQKCVLISTIRSPSELPPSWRTLRMLAVPYLLEMLLAVVGFVTNCIPSRLRSSSVSPLAKFVGPHGRWYRWATAAVLRWQPRGELDQIPTIQIHGAEDRTFPIAFTRPEIIIPHAGHVLPLSHPEDLAGILLSLK
jgi:pimeloyl-ACP methyl ester carboxylesterase